MRYRCILLVVALAGSFVLKAQDNPLGNGLRESYQVYKTFLLAEAERMPDADYSFKPTPEAETFGSRVAHVADSLIGVCSGAKGVRSVHAPTDKTSKADLVAELKMAFDYCDGPYSSLADATAAQEVIVFGRRMSKLTALWGNLAHIQEQYGYMAVYLRLKGLTPPLDDPKLQMSVKRPGKVMEAPAVNK
jgi:hypothetical protein